MITTQAMYNGEVIVPKNRLPLLPDTEITIHIEEKMNPVEAKTMTQEQWLRDLSRLRQSVTVHGPALSGYADNERQDRM